MFDLKDLPEEEQQAIQNELQWRYRNADGEDIDLAIKRYRRILAEHDRELEHVSKMDFGKPYRWRVAPGIALRAEKALEAQKKKQVELLNKLYVEILRDRGHIGQPKTATEENAPTLEKVDDLTSRFADALKQFAEWRSTGAEEGSPSATSAA